MHEARARNKNFTCDVRNLRKFRVRQRNVHGVWKFAGDVHKSCQLKNGGRDPVSFALYEGWLFEIGVSGLDFSYDMCFRSKWFCSHYKM